MGRFNETGEYKIRDTLASLTGPHSIIGRSMVIYEREDDFDQTEHPATKERPFNKDGSEERRREGKGKPIGCCVIGIAKDKIWAG